MVRQESQKDKWGANIYEFIYDYILIQLEHVSAIFIGLLSHVTVKYDRETDGSDF